MPVDALRVAGTVIRGCDRGSSMLEIGTIGKAHGLRGDVVVRLTTDQDGRLDAGNELHTDRGVLVVEWSSPYQQRWRVHFVGVDDRTAAEALRGVALRAEPIEDPDTWFVHQLIGARVETVDGVVVGTCVSVVDNPAHDLIEVDDGTLVPMPFVASVDLDTDPGAIVIDPPEGLLDLASGRS